MKVKLVIDKTERVLDPNGKPAFTDAGDQQYNLHFQWVIACDAPEGAKRQESKS